MGDDAQPVDLSGHLAGPLGPPFHLGLTTCALEPTMELLSSLLGVSWTGIFEEPPAGLTTAEGPCDWAPRRAWSRSGPLPLELFEGSPGSTWATDAALAVHHLAYWSHDVGGDCERLATDGWRAEVFLADPGSRRPRDFAYLVRPGTTRIELVAVERRPDHLARLRAG